MCCYVSWSFVFKSKKVFLSENIFDSSNSFYTQSIHLISILEKFNIKASQEKRVKDWNSIKQYSIVAINYKENEQDPTWHWVVYVPDEGKGYVLDPKKTIKTTKRVDFKRMKPRFYIPILN